MAIPPPFPNAAPVVVLLGSPLLKGQLDPIRSDTRFAKMGVALVDMTTRTRNSLAFGGLNFVYGWNMHQTQFAASLVKIAAMFGAFRLRENLRVAATGLSAKSPDDLLHQITAEWKPIVEQRAKGAPKDFPDLKAIFSVSGASGGWVVNFQPKFQTNLEKMIGPSDNHAASFCILSIGYQYINGALAAEGLYYPGQGGLWLAGDYTKAGRDWNVEPNSRKNQAASAAAVARFLALIETNRLVSEKASAEMRGLMNNFYMSRIMDANSRAMTGGFGKLGIGPSSSPGFHDAAVIERSVGGKTIRYAAVMLGADVVNFTMTDLGVHLDNVVLSVHGLPIPT